MIISVTSNTDINWAAKGSDKIADNVANILKTRIGDVPYMRGLGVSPGYIDMPVTDIKGQLISDAVSAIAEYEPRATVKEIEIVEADQSGEITIKVVIEI